LLKPRSSVLKSRRLFVVFSSAEQIERRRQRIDVNDDDGEYLSRSDMVNTVVHPPLGYRLADSLLDRLVLRAPATIRGLY